MLLKSKITEFYCMADDSVRNLHGDKKNIW